jgi:hypothetical protein
MIPNSRNDRKQGASHLHLVQFKRHRLGLLYELLSAFGEGRISIALSISTEKGAAIDTFTWLKDAREITDPAGSLLAGTLHRARGLPVCLRK